MPMKSPNKIMGKVKSPSFFKGSISQSSSTKASPLKRNMPVLLALVLLGVAIILYLRSRSSGTSMTGPLVQTGLPASDTSSTIASFASQGLVNVSSAIPTGGTSTPITSLPTTTTPASTNEGYSTYSRLPSAIQDYIASKGYGEMPYNDPVRFYTRDQQITYMAQIAEVLRTGTYLPNASGAGLNILPGTPRYPASSQDLQAYQAVLNQTMADWGISSSELSAEQAKVRSSYESGVAYTPGPTDPYERQLNELNKAIVGKQGAYTTAQLSAINYLGGVTSANLTNIQSQGGLAYLNQIATQQKFAGVGEMGGGQPNLS